MNGNVEDGIDQEEYNILQFAGGLFFGIVITVTLYILYLFLIYHLVFIYFLAIAIVHCGIFHSFFLSHYERIREEAGEKSDDHPYIAGLNKLGVAHVGAIFVGVRIFRSNLFLI